MVHGEDVYPKLQKLAFDKPDALIVCDLPETYWLLPSIMHVQDVARCAARADAERAWPDLCHAALAASSSDAKLELQTPSEASEAPGSLAGPPSPDLALVATKPLQSTHLATRASPEPPPHTERSGVSEMFKVNDEAQIMDQDRTFAARADVSVEMPDFLEQLRFVLTAEHNLASTLQHFERAIEAETNATRRSILEYLVKATTTRGQYAPSPAPPPAPSQTTVRWRCPERSATAACTAARPVLSHFEAPPPPFL
jgi:hypothetical protein